MRLYCYLDSDNSIESTNLQLYSLRQAARSWNELVSELEKYEEKEIEDFKERLVFISNCLGLSLSQLLGQTWSSENQNKTGTPEQLLSNVLNCSFFHKNEKNRLNKAFSNDFLPAYDAIRHFGKASDGSKYKIIEDIDLAKTKRFIKLAIDIWDAIICVQRSNDLNNIDEFSSITEIVNFSKI